MVKKGERSEGKRNQDKREEVLVTGRVKREGEQSEREGVVRGAMEGEGEGEGR